MTRASIAPAAFAHRNCDARAFGEEHNREDDEETEARDVRGLPGSAGRVTTCVPNAVPTTAAIAQDKPFPGIWLPR